MASGILAGPDIVEVLPATVVPHIQFNAAFATTLVAILGTTISPYLFFWQASEEVEEEIQRGRYRLWQRRGATNRELKYSAWYVNQGMAIPVVVMYFIMLATGATLTVISGATVRSSAPAGESVLSGQLTVWRAARGRGSVHPAG